MKRILKKILRISGYDDRNTSSPVTGYLSAQKTIAAAKKRGLSVCDYVEQLWNEKGKTQSVIEEIQKYVDFGSIMTICEIGPGTGRYLDKLLRVVKPIRYEIYETAQDWSSWLQREYRVIAQIASGTTLRQTPDSSIDFLHAHGVFQNIPFFATVQYFREIQRVVANDGYVAFDIMSEDCLHEETVTKWINSNLMYPYFLSTSYVINSFNKNFEHVGSFLRPYAEGKSKYMVFKKA